MEQELDCAKCHRPLTYIPPVSFGTFGGRESAGGGGRYECDYGCLGDVDPRNQ